MPPSMQASTGWCSSSAGVPGYDVRYVRAVTQDPTDQPIRLQGGAVLRVVLRHASTSPGPGGGPVPLFVGTIAPDLPSLKQVKVADVAHAPAPSSPVPGIWDVRTWEDARELQDAVEHGHQPWRCAPDRLVTLYAEQVLHLAQPVVRRGDASAFTVTRPGQGVVATISVTQPFTGRACGIWVITSVITNP